MYIVRHPIMIEITNTEHRLRILNFSIFRLLFLVFDAKLIDAECQLNQRIQANSAQLGRAYFQLYALHGENQNKEKVILKFKINLNENSKCSRNNF